MASNTNYAFNRKYRHMTVMVLAAIIAVMLFSSCYIILEADHDCTDASCLICAAIQQCGNNLLQLGSGHLTVLAASAVLCFICIVITAVYGIIFTQTPVTRKVRLNN